MGQKKNRERGEDCGCGRAYVWPWQLRHSRCGRGVCEKQRALPLRLERWARRLDEENEREEAEARRKEEEERLREEALREAEDQRMLNAAEGGDTDDSDADAGSNVSDDSSVEADLEENEDYQRAMAEDLSDWSGEEV